MKKKTLSLCIAIGIANSGCGGGGGNSSDAMPTSQPSVVAKNICLHGNSIMRGSYVPSPGVVVRSSYAPATVLAWPGNFPNAIIRDYSVDGEAVWGMRASANWPRLNCDVGALLHYSNDGHDFEAQLNLALNEMTDKVKILVIANLPSLSVNPAWTYVYTNAETVRRVAAQRGVKLCDANLGTNYNHPDGMHPDDNGYAILSGTIVRCLKEVL